jgi:hypothetical protein
MANPRNTVAYDDIGSLTATYLIDNSTITYDVTKVGGSAQVGLAVTISANKTVALAADAQSVHGRLQVVEADNKATVQVAGYMKLPGGTSATLTPGTRVVGALLVAAKGYVRSVAAATLAEVVVSRGEIIDATDTANVVVKL